MRIIDAFWEKRNLGVTTCEVTIEAQDDTAAVSSTFEELLLQYEYLVFRVPCYRLDVALELQGKGCAFMETAITLQNDLKNFSVDGKYKLLCDKCSWAVMDDADLARLYDEIRAGIFQTDRIYLDAHFSKAAAANRYVNWVRDLIKEDCRPHKVLFGGKVVGFFADKQIGVGVFKGLLAAIYHGFLQTGLGFTVQYAGFACALERGASWRELNVSSNNLPVIKINLELGARIKNLEYVLVRHQENS